MEKKQLGSKIAADTKNKFKIQCVKLGLKHNEVMEILIKNFNKNGLPE